jgi:hypothetical protein
MALSTITNCATTAILKIYNSVTTVSTMIVKYLFDTTANSEYSTYSTLTLANTSGVVTDGSLQVLDSSGNYITNYINLTTATAPGITIMFKMKLTTVVNYPTAQYRYNIAMSKSESLEDGYWAVYLQSGTGNASPPNFCFIYMPSPVSGSGNNKVNPMVFLQIPSSVMSYDNAYHHYAITINPTDGTGNNFYLENFLDATKYTSTTGGNTVTNNYNNFLQMKRVGLFPASFSIVGQTVTVSNVPAICRITDFRIYSKVLSSLEITHCMNGLNI